MASLFKPDVPQQNPQVAKQQQDEQDRAEAARTRATQAQLTQETLLRSRSGSIRSLLGAFGSGGSTLGSG
jgi:ABC-type hemin transport system ATPase subunit